MTAMAEGRSSIARRREAELISDLDRKCDELYTLERTLAYSLGGRRVQIPERGYIQEVVRDLDLARRLARELDRVDARDRAVRLSAQIRCALDRTTWFQLDLTLTPIGDQSQAVAGVTHRIRATAFAKIIQTDLERLLAISLRVAARHGATRSDLKAHPAIRKKDSAAGRRAMEMAVMLLPPTDRPRYTEEFSSEFAELRGRSLRAQRTYALRVLLSAVRLRRALKRTDPRRAWES
jgi:hypothetical protein